jgi:hypothetical protein
MGKIKQFSGMQGGQLPQNCLTFVSYIVTILIFIIAMYAVYSPQISFLGVVLLYFINIIYSVLLAKDLFGSPKSVSSPAILFIMIAVLGLNFASSTIVILSLQKIRSEYAKYEKKMELSNKTRNTLSFYVAGWIATIVMLWILSIFYFVEPPELSFFSYEFIDKEIGPLFMLIGFLIKVVSAMASLGISSYMIFLANSFLGAKSRIIVPT